MKRVCRCEIPLHWVGLYFIVLTTVLAAEPTEFVLRDNETLDTKMLLGKWRIDKFLIRDEESGEMKDLSEVLTLNLLIPAEDQIRVESRTGSLFEFVVIEYNFKKTPAWIELRPKERKDRTITGILKLDGDNLVIHLGKEARPKDFEQGKGISSILLKCKRAK